MDFYGTIGPACAQPAILQHMVEAGMTGIRMNLSHGPLAAHTDWLAMIRAAGIRQLLIDLQGPELRIGTLAEPVALVEGSSVRLGADGVPCPAALVQAAAPGQQLLLDDGKLLVQVTQALPEALVCTVVRGGTLQSRKSIAAPGLAVALDLPMTEEDLQNLENCKAVRCYRCDAAFCARQSRYSGPCAMRWKKPGLRISVSLPKLKT